ncbi:MAG: hypothetical protein WB805_13610 [Candidatus Dormiibacterota bacterium]
MVPSDRRRKTSFTVRALTQRSPEASTAMSSGETPNRWTTWSAALDTGAAQLASVVGATGVGVAGAVVGAGVGVLVACGCVGGVCAVDVAQPLMTPMTIATLTATA